MEENNNNLIFKTNSIFGETIILTQEQFKNHIINRHPELISHEDDIKRTIQTPHLVYTSERYPETRKIFIRKTNNNEISNYNNVIVEYLAEEDGVVKTSYYSQDITGGGKCVYFGYENKL